MKGIYWIIGVVLVLLVVGGVGYGFVRDGVSIDLGETGALGEKSGDSALQPVKAVVEQIPEPEPTTVIDIEALMAQEGLGDIAQLEAVNPYEGSGFALRSFEEGVFSHSVQAELPGPAEGKFYEGWLVKTSPSLAFFSTGKLELGPTGYEVIFTADQPYPGYDQVVVTEETERLGLDGTPEAHVLEGVFEN